MTKLCIVTRFFPDDYIGGGEFFIYNIWKKAKIEFNTSLISGWIKNPNVLPAEVYKIDLRSKNRFVRYWNFYFKVKKYVGQIKPDIIHSNAIEMPVVKTPTLIMVHHLGHFFNLKGVLLHRKMVLLFQRYLVRKRLTKAKMIAAVSQATADDILRLGIDRKKVRVVYPAIETETLKPRKTKNDKFTITYPSRISSEKGQHIAIKAFKMLPNSMKKKCRLLLPGFVSDEKYLEMLMQDIGEEDIEIIPNVPKMADYYMDADLIIFPTLMFEGFGRVSVEGMCSGKAVIASDFPAIREVVKNYGFLVTPGDPKQLRDAIVKLYKNKKLRDKLGAEGRKYVLQNYTWDKVFSNYKKLYQELLETKVK